MRFLIRLPKPDILTKKESIWTEEYIKSGAKRPDNKKYGHPKIKETLHNCSFKKCFYSEYKFPQETEGQVDHNIEVDEDKTKAFEWENLFLSHKDCNQGRVSNSVIPIEKTLNPFIHSDEEIEKCLGFEDENIIGKNEMGLLTIQKYRLDKDIFNKLRSTELRKFEQLLIHILKNMNAQQRKINTDELEILNLYSKPYHAFSLMFRLVLKKHGLFIP